MGTRPVIRDENQTTDASGDSTPLGVPPSPRPLPLIVHERGRFWGVQIRPRLEGMAVRVQIRETRTMDDLRAAIRTGRGGIILIDLTAQPVGPLDLVARVAAWDSSAALVVVGRRDHVLLAGAIRELGAVHFACQPAPPELVGLVLGPLLRTQQRRLDRLPAARADLGGPAPL